ncbi:hypothetical protein L9H26_18730 [Morganella psychrotolerans]|nr:hypothetical protein [Morganella psychrotolerans]
MTPPVTKPEDKTGEADKDDKLTDDKTEEVKKPDAGESKELGDIDQD